MLYFEKKTDVDEDEEVGSLIDNLLVVGLNATDSGEIATICRSVNVITLVNLIVAFSYCEVALLEIAIYIFEYIDIGRR